MYGIESVMLPKAPREEAWRRLGSDLPLDKLDSTVSDAALGDLTGARAEDPEGRGARPRGGRRQPLDHRNACLPPSANGGRHELKAPKIFKGTIGPCVVGVLNK